MSESNYSAASDKVTMQTLDQFCNRLVLFCQTYVTESTTDTNNSF